ncbi:MAG: 4Fe-4S binding protein [Thermoplasmata archaeon]|nr:4Fe-4S binding protein [Thermoplasmata archaeon]
MAKRKIIRIDEEKCNGCGLCIPNCPEGALQIIDEKARLVSDLFCDGLGACIGHCPEDAITIEEREAEEYDEKKVMENIVKQGKNTIRAHLEHLKEHGATEYLDQAIGYLKEHNVEIPLGEESTAQHTPGHMDPFSGCPGSKMMQFEETEEETNGAAPVMKGVSRLRQWPIQIMLVPPFAPYLKNADLLVAADCVPFAYAAFHEDFLKGKVVLIGCPKLDDAEFYKQKLTEIVKTNELNSLTVVHMEVPCCFGLVQILKSAIADSGKDIPFETVTVSIKGEKMD